MGCGGPDCRVSVTVLVARGILGVMADDDFAAMYAREGEVVLVFLARRTLDAAIAADLTAETFAQAFRSWPRLRGRSEPEVRAWLFTVARRQVSRYLRRGRVERRALQRLGIRVPMLHEDVRRSTSAPGSVGCAPRWGLSLRVWAQSSAKRFVCG